MGLAGGPLRGVTKRSPRGHAGSPLRGGQQEEPPGDTADLQQNGTQEPTALCRLIYGQSRRFLFTNGVYEHVT